MQGTYHPKQYGICLMSRAFRCYFFLETVYGGFLSFESIDYLIGDVIGLIW